MRPDIVIAAQVCRTLSVSRCRFEQRRHPTNIHSKLFAICCVANLDLRAKKFEEIKFVSDGDYCGRGFKALYEQIACTYPGHPVDPTHPTTPPTTTTTSTPRPVSCDRTIPNHAFVLDVENYSPMSCNFDVLKSNRVF